MQSAAEQSLAGDGAIACFSRNFSPFSSDADRAPQLKALVRRDDVMATNKSRIMYIEPGGGLEGPGRIGRASLSKTGRTVYYRGRVLGWLGGSGYKTTHFDEETREEYWLSGPRKDGQDTLYPGVVEIDEDVREAYWLEVRNCPDCVREASFRSLGRHAKKRRRKVSAGAAPRAATDAPPPGSMGGILSRRRAAERQRSAW